MSLIEKNKTDQNTPVEDINTITNPSTRTLIDRYIFASNFCKNKTVCDCASGSGFGSALLWALGAKEVLGLDIDDESVVNSAKKYKHENIDFAKADLTTTIDGFDNKFDVIVSIETFEHVKRTDVNRMLRNFKRFCKNKGHIIITTPRRTTEEFEYDGGTHLYVYSREEFKEELHRLFDDVKFYYALEYVLTGTDETRTLFSEDKSFADKCNVMVAVIKNEKVL